MERDSLIGSLLITAATLLLLFGMTEVALRVYTAWFITYDIEMTRYAMDIKIESPNPLIGHIHRSNSEARLMGVPVKINSDGFRDDEYPIERSNNHRLVFLGDSLTFGWGVEKSKTFEAILEAELSKARPTEIINLGTGNYNTEQEVALFFEKGMKYRPDEVVVFYFINDAEPTAGKSAWQFLGYSRLVTFFWSRFKIAVTKFGQSKSFRDYYAELYTDNQPGWIAAKRALIALRDACLENRVALRVILLPELHVLDPYAFAGEHKKIMTFLKDSNIEAYDLAPQFGQEKDPMHLWVAPDDAHPNDIAHAMIARYSFPLLLRSPNAPTTEPN